jgi:large subunit ribosomal protein L28e
MSADLQWMVIRNNSCFLMKRKNAPQFSRESNNLKGLNSFRYNGLVHRKTVGVEPAADGKGVVLITKKTGSKRKMSKVMKRTDLKRNARKTFATIRKVIGNSGYRKDLQMPAVRRASAILSSQKPILTKKTRRGRGKKKE